MIEIYGFRYSISIFKCFDIGLGFTVLASEAGHPRLSFHVTGEADHDGEDVLVRVLGLMVVVVIPVSWRRSLRWSAFSGKERCPLSGLSKERVEHVGSGLVVMNVK
mgnify:CR=1 FL=1